MEAQQLLEKLKEKSQNSPPHDLTWSHRRADLIRMDTVEEQLHCIMSNALKWEKKQKAEVKTSRDEKIVGHDRHDLSSQF